MLGKLGLDTREQTVYLALLKLGLASVVQIAQAAQVERTGIYAVLKKLIGLGLVTETIVGKKRRFVAQDPQRLLEIVRENERAVSAVLPDLQALWTATDVRPRIRFYQGAEGMRTVLLDTLTAPDKQLRGILSAEDLFATVGERWMENYTKQRIAAGLSLHVVRSAQKEVGERWSTSAAERRELRYAPATMVFSSTLYIYANKVALLSTRQENFGLIIESDEFAATQSHLFDALWQISNPVAEAKIDSGVLDNESQ